MDESSDDGSSNAGSDSEGPRGRNIDRVSSQPEMKAFKWLPRASFSGPMTNEESLSLVKKEKDAMHGPVEGLSTSHKLPF